MLVSEKLKLVCAGDESVNDKSIRNFMQSIGFKESDTNYENYDKFIFLVNPYQKVLNFYMNVVLSSLTPIFKDKKNDYIFFFREWVSKIFHCEKLIVELTFDGTDENYTKVLSKFRISEIDPIFMVRDENFIYDIKKIKNFDDFDLVNLTYKWKINEFYDYETAKIIFHFYKNDFFMGQYNPFSFSEDNFRLERKIDFIHELF